MTATQKFIVAFTAFCLLVSISALATSFYCEYDLQRNGINVEELLKR